MKRIRLLHHLRHLLREWSFRHICIQRDHLIYCFKRFETFKSQWLGRVGSFLGGSVVKNPPANAEDTGLIPDQGRSRLFHRLWNN